MVSWWQGVILYHIKFVAMTEASKEPTKPVDAESEANLAIASEQPEEWVRRKVVPPVDADPLDDGDRSPGGSGRGFDRSIMPAPLTDVEQTEAISETVVPEEDVAGSS